MKLLFTVLCSLALAVAAPAAGRHTKSDKPLSISQGQTIEFADFYVPGKFTVFVFTSEYAQPCREYDEKLYQLHQQRENVAVVKVDINRPAYHQVDWDSPVAKQYDLHTVPYFIVYGPDGKLVAADTPDDRAGRTLVDRMIEALR